MTRTTVAPADLETMRRSAGLTQAEMADIMHISVRSYEELSSGRTMPRPIHRRAAEMGLLTLARAKDNPDLLPEHLRELVDDLHKLIHRTPGV